MVHSLYRVKSSWTGMKINEFLRKESRVEWRNIEKPEENFNNSADPLLWKSGANVTMRRQYTVSSSAFTVSSIISGKNVKMFAALLRLGNEIAMLFQPIPSANGTDKFVEIRLSTSRMQRTFSFRWRTVLCVSFFSFSFFVNSLPLWNHTRYHKSMRELSMLFHVKFCRSY